MIQEGVGTPQEPGCPYAHIPFEQHTKQDRRGPDPHEVNSDQSYPEQGYGEQDGIPSAG